MTEDRNRRKERQGIVVSTAGDKTCVVKVEERKPHPLYGKMMTRSTKFHAHDESNQCGVGDVVTIMETRPLSKLKRWRLVEIVEKAK
jgi:small subunit ribosomal protein S17